MSYKNLKGYDPFFEQKGMTIKCAHTEAWFTNPLNVNLGPVMLILCNNCAARTNERVFGELLMQASAHAIVKDKKLKRAVADMFREVGKKA